MHVHVAARDARRVQQRPRGSRLSKFQRGTWTGAVAGAAAAMRGKLNVRTTLQSEVSRPVLQARVSGSKKALGSKNQNTLSSTQFRFCNIVTTFSAKGARCVGEHSSLRSTRGPTAAPPHVHTPPPASITCLVPTPTAYLLPPAPL